MKTHSHLLTNKPIACAQDPLDETTSTSDLTTPIVKRPFKPIEQVHLKAFIKLTHQKSKAQHHHRTLEESLRLERLPRGLTPTSNTTYQRLLQV